MNKVCDTCKNYNIGVDICDKNKRTVIDFFNCRFWDKKETNLLMEYTKLKLKFELLQEYSTKLAKRLDDIGDVVYRDELLPEFESKINNHYERMV